ncbi:MAG: hypothetical protein AAB342_03035 [Chloroflexota bacterium]|mgnify:FL=1
MRPKLVITLIGFALIVALIASAIVAVVSNTTISALAVMCAALVAMLIGLLVGYGMRIGRGAIKNIRRDSAISPRRTH